MANAIEILTRLTGVPEVTRGLDQVKGKVAETGKASNDAAPAVSRFGAAIQTAVGVATGLLAERGLRAFVGFLTSSVDASRQADRALRQLGSAIDATGTKFRDVRGSAERLISRLEDLSGIADDDLAVGLRDLVRITGDVQTAMGLLGTAADVAAGASMDLSSAAELVGRAAIGETRQLRQMGIVLREGATGTEAITALQRQFAGQAAASADAVDRLANAWDNFKEAIGGALTILEPVLNVMTAMAKAAADMVKGLEQTQEAIARRRAFERLPMSPTAADFQLAESAPLLVRLTQRRAENARLTGPVPDRAIVRIFEDLDRAVAKAETRFRLFGETDDLVQAKIRATETALAALITRGLGPTDTRVAGLAGRLDALQEAFQRLQVAAEAAGRQTGAEQSARQQAREMQAAAEATERAQVALDAFHVQDAERQLEALALANQHVADEADRATAALERVAGAMTLSESTARANNRQVQRTSQVLSDAEIAMERWTGLTLENMTQVQDVTQTLWTRFEFGAADAFAAVLIEGESFARRFKDLLRTLASDVIRLFARLGLQRGLFGTFTSGTAGTAGVVEGGVPVQGVGAAGAGAVTGAGAGAAVGLGIPLAALGAQFLFDLGTKLGGGTREAQIGSGAGGALFGLVTGGLGFLGGGVLGGAFGGSRGRRERRRSSQQQQAVKDLMALGIDEGTAEAIVAQQEASRGDFGTGGAFFELKDLIDLASVTGLRGESAARGFGFVSNFATNRETALGEIGDVRGGLAGFGPQAAETVGILTQGAAETLRNWERVDAFFVRFGETLEAVGETLDQGVAQGIGAAIQSWLSGAGSLFAGIRQGLRAAIESAIIEAIVNGVVIEGILGPHLERLRDAIVKGTEDPATVIREIAGLIPHLASSIQALVAPLIPALNAVAPPGTGATGVFPVPAFAAGGIVTAPTLAVIGEAGPEAVVPLGGARGGMTLELHDTIEVDGDVLARVVRRRLPSQIRLGDFAGR